MCGGGDVALTPGSGASGVVNHDYPPRVMQSLTAVRFFVGAEMHEGAIRLEELDGIHECLLLMVPLCHQRIIPNSSEATKKLRPLLVHLNAHHEPRHSHDEAADFRRCARAQAAYCAQNHLGLLLVHIFDAWQQSQKWGTAPLECLLVSRRLTSFGQTLVGGGSVTRTLLEHSLCEGTTCILQPTCGHLLRADPLHTVRLIRPQYLTDGLAKCDTLNKVTLNHRSGEISEMLLNHSVDFGIEAAPVTLAPHSGFGCSGCR